MTPDEAKKRIDELTPEVSRLEEAYRRQAQPEIEDYQFDQLYKELLELEQEYPDFAWPDSPTKKIGDDRTQGFQQVEHRQKMLSLDNTYNETEVRAFHARMAKLFGTDDLRYTVEPKIDGLAVSLTYENGKFLRAVTRGDGEKGDDVTANALAMITTLPRELGFIDGPLPRLVEIRGEIYLTAAEFERINLERAAEIKKLQEEREKRRQERIAEGKTVKADAGAVNEKLYANPRNLAAGTIKQIDPLEATKRKLSIVLYGLGYCDPQIVTSQTDLHEKLNRWKLPTVERIWTVRGIDEAWAAIGELDQLRRTFAYGTDGAVIKIDEFNQQEQAETTAKAPRWAIAYKYKPDTARTRLKAITIQVGKTGILSPVAVLTPVLLAGSTISRATLHNEEEIRRKDIRIGDLVEIEKAGEVIPAVLRSFPEERPVGAQEFDLPAAVGHKCPVCGGNIAKIAVANETEGVAWKCQNYDCRAQRVGRLELFCSRRALAIDSVGEIVAAKLVDRGLVNSVLDLFSIGERTLAELNLGTEEKKRVLGEPLARKIIQAREAARNLPLAKWLYALSIPDIGEETARDISILHADMNAVSSSEALRDISELARLNDEIIDTSPQAKKNKNKTEAEKEVMRPIWKDNIQRADALGEKLIAQGYAERAWKLPREAIIQVENAETAKLRELLATIDDNSVKERKGKNAAETERMKSMHESAKKQADKLGVELVAAGYAERASQPARSATTVIGPIAACSAMNWFGSEIGQQFLKQLKELGIEPKGGKSVQVASPFSEKTVVISGTIPGMTRPEAQEKVRLLGGSIASSVSSKTDMLIAGPGAGSKLEDARKYGVRVVDESEFLKLLGVDTPPSTEFKLE